MFLLAVIRISLSRGIPRVTFISPRPEKNGQDGAFIDGSRDIIATINYQKRIQTGEEVSFLKFKDQVFPLIGYTFFSFQQISLGTNHRKSDKSNL